MSWLGPGGGGGWNNSRGRGRGRGRAGGRGGGRDGNGRFMPAPDDWLCPDPACGNMNFARRTECNRCGKPKGGPGGTKLHSCPHRLLIWCLPAFLNPCVVCFAVVCVYPHLLNFQLRLGGAAPPGGPPGLFKPGDWPCVICGNVNWQSRTACNRCGEKKPGLNNPAEKREVGWLVGWWLDSGGPFVVTFCST